MVAAASSIYPLKATLRSSSSSRLLPIAKQRFLSHPPSLKVSCSTDSETQTGIRARGCAITNDVMVVSALFGVGFSLSMVDPSSAAESPLWGSSLQLNEPSNALSLPTWVVHVSSVVEWVTAMFLVWQYGKKPGCEAWKGLSWGMVPLLGGALCACTWHFFYNSESLEALVTLQAALTVIGNATMCIAAYRIYKSQGRSKTS
ncbi:hypothetical protein Nepgr_030734 [Nepenthes gracilis]|uniref:Ycf49-like protein n=1 Tax=Nepenthes gracilis TaxID=150966 RepID=A0AAD3Y6V3_NEPGR|nr:hypothetical protein Nepgr_030734 [Nepenthes gracilis]